MPTMAAITVKKKDGVTDVVWTNVQASGGDKSPAIWRNQTVVVPNAFQPEFRLASRAGSLNQRVLTGSGDWKTVATGSDGVIKRQSLSYLNFEARVAQEMSSADIGEFAYQIAHLIASTLVKSSIEAGFAPT